MDQQGALRVVLLLSRSHIQRHKRHRFTHHIDTSRERHIAQLSCHSMSVIDSHTVHLAAMSHKLTSARLCLFRYE